MNYFYISMHDIMGMHVLNGITDAVENPSNQLFIVELVVPYVIEKSSIFSILKNDISGL